MGMILILTYILLSAGGLVLFKLGTSISVTSLSLESGELSVSINAYSMIGLCCYICSFLLYLWIVSKYDLTKIYPITSGLIYILVFLGGMMILHEPMSTVKTIGSIVVLAGVILMNL